MKHELAIVSCQAARAFSERVVEHLRALYVENKDNPAISDEPSNIHLTEAGGVSEPDKVTAFFEDGEPAHRLREAVHGRDIFVIQTLQSPVSLPGRSINDNLVELCHLNHTLCLSDAAQITNVIPYGGAYGRQDRKVKAREGISTQFLALMLEGTLLRDTRYRIITMDFHSEQIQGVFRVPTDRIPGFRVFYNYITHHLRPATNGNVVVFSPDRGGVDRAGELSTLLKVPIAFGNKRRSGPWQVAEKYDLAGEVKDKIVYVIDDLIASGSAVEKAVEELRLHGAKEVYYFATHSLMLGNAYERLAKLNVPVITTNTIEQKPAPWLTRLDISPIMAQAIYAAHTKQSMEHTIRNIAAPRIMTDEWHKA